MSAKQSFGLIGSIMLIIGVFCPIIDLPIVEDWIFMDIHGDGVIILALALLSLIFVVLRVYKGLYPICVVSLCIILFDLVNTYLKIDHTKIDIQSKVSNNIFDELTKVAAQSVRLGWGWAILIIGTGCLIASVLVKEEKSQN